jgi:hypothetical protein
MAGNDLTSAVYLDNYRIKFVYEDLHENVVDFQEFISRSNHPSVKKYSDIELFRQFGFDRFGVEWNEMEMCFPAEWLRYGNHSR